MINVDIYNDILSLVSLYAPNDPGTQEEFFKYAWKWINKHTLNETNLLIAGDFNNYLRQCDKTTDTMGNLLDRGHTQFLKFIKNLNLKDVFQLKHGNKVNYTFERGDTYKSRIDYIFINGQIDIIETYSRYLISGKKENSISDHKAVYATFGTPVFTRGPNYWKLNTKLLLNNEYVDEINRLLDTEKENFLQTKSKKLFWEGLKQKIKQTSIEFSAKIAKDEKGRIRKLEMEIQNLNDSNIPEEIKNQIILTKQTEIDEFYEKRAEGARIRSRVNWWEKGEKSNNYFLRLENERQSLNMIRKININGKIKSEDNDILFEIDNFYRKLYASDNISTESVQNFLANVNSNRELNETEKMLCEGQIKESECEQVIVNLKPNKSPGLDGLCQEFYKIFWPKLKVFFCQMVKEVFETGSLCDTMQKAVISLIYKKGEKDKLNNYRPISILNVDYKIVAFVLSNRLQRVLGSIVPLEQSAYIKGRYIGNNCRYILDTIDYCKEFKVNGLLCFLDFHKAFDSLSHEFLIKTLYKYKFGTSFIHWINILYHQPLITVKNNGWLTKPIPMQRGIRQGCPISGMLFILVTDLMACIIKQNENISGIKLKNGTVTSTILQYADDTTLLLGDINSLKDAVDGIQKFSQVSGLTLNKQKSEIICLGPKEINNEVLYGIKHTINPVKYLGIYLGQDMETCNKKQWDTASLKIDCMLNKWKQRDLSIKGKILILKSLAIPKLTMILQLLPYKKDIILQLNRKFYKFIWGTRDRIKRKTLIGDYQDGGLKMIDLELFGKSLRASWIPRLFGFPSALNPFGKMYIDSICKNFLVLIHGLYNRKMYNFSDISEFYSEMLYNFSECLDNAHPVSVNRNCFFSQYIWFNKHFLYKGTCLNLKSWIESGFIFVKDLFNGQGKFVSGKYVMEKLTNKSNWLCEWKIMKHVFNKFESVFDCSEAVYNNTTVNNIFQIGGQNVSVDRITNSLLYKILVNKNVIKSNAKKIWSNEFNFTYETQFFKNIFIKKVQNQELPKLAEFSYKILNNILPTNETVNKWNKTVSKLCPFCKKVEDLEHLLYNCSLLESVWSKFELAFKCSLNWKLIVLGYSFDTTRTVFIEKCLTITTYSMYNYKIKCKMKGNNFVKEGLLNNVKYFCLCYRQYLDTRENYKYLLMFDNFLKLL